MSLSRIVHLQESHQYNFFEKVLRCHGVVLNFLKDCLRSTEEKRSVQNCHTERYFHSVHQFGASEFFNMVKFQLLFLKGESYHNFPESVLRQSTQD